MARKKTAIKAEEDFTKQNPAKDQDITETLEVNYMPYAMSVIISRAIPEIDGFKPAHRKILYTMYKMGLNSTAHRTKSANVVGETMKLNPHGDMSIYETMVRLTRDYQALLHPFIDSKGHFGTHYSTEAFAASRYTNVRLDEFCQEIFRGIDKNAVDFIPNYDNTQTEPKLLPTSFPNILVSQNTGIAVGIATRICSFNLEEVCNATIEVLSDPSCDVDKILDIMPAPDFSGGGILLYDRAQMAEIYKTGKGSFKMRARYKYDAKSNCIEIDEIPDSTTVEAIHDKICDIIKNDTIKEISDCRDETDLSGLKYVIDLKKGADVEKIMAKLFKMTPLESTISPNFNVIINQNPYQLGVIGILNEWIRFRLGCVRRECEFDLNKKLEKLHLLEGLGKILLDIDKAIKIIRGTKKESEVVPNLMTGFSIDKIQADYIADIKLRHLNREYILNRIAETDKLRREIAELEKLIKSEKLQKKLIIKQLEEIKAKYKKPRKTQIVPIHEVTTYVKEETVEDYPVRIVMTREGYFKKITLQSLRGNDEQTVKTGDEVILNEERANVDTLLFFSNKAQCYKGKVADFETTKSSLMGDFVPVKLKFDKGEDFLFLKPLKEYDPATNIIFIFENGKGVKVPITAYETKGNRSKLKGAYSDKSPIVAAFSEDGGTPVELVIWSNDGKCIQISSSLIPQSTTRSAQGVTLFSLKKNGKVEKAELFDGDRMKFAKSPKKIKIPATGVGV